MADSGFQAREKYPGFNEDKTIFYNAGVITTASTWFRSVDGFFSLTPNITDARMEFPITGLRLGDKLKYFRVLGALGADTGYATNLDAYFRKVTKGAGVVSTATIAAITQVTAQADAEIDSEVTLSETVVTADTQYYVQLEGTTANSAVCDLAITGIEVDIERA